jgi:hypothetical protein
MLTGTCHCGAIRIDVPRSPTELTNCNCSLCRRVGALWAYYDVAEVTVHGHPEHTEGWIQGDRTLSTVRCRTCGCVTHWEPIGELPGTRMGVNMRQFDPAEVGKVRIRLFDGAESWKTVGWVEPD